MALLEVLERVREHMQTLSREELSKYRLNEGLGGRSPSIALRALKRIYG